MARLAAAEQDLASALSRAQAALGASPTSTDAVLFKADILSAKGDADAARSAYRSAIELAPHRVEPRFGLIVHLVRQRSLDEASTEVQALDKIAPNDLRSRYAKALVFAEQRKFKQAQEALQQVLNVAPEHVPSLILAARAAYELGAYAQAESHLRKALLRVPKSVQAKRMLATTHLRMRRLDMALAEVQELLKDAGKDPAVVTLAGEVHLARGEIEEAARYYEQARNLRPDNPELGIRLAQVRLAAGDADRGIRELESAVSSNPDSHQADLALVVAYLRQRQPDKALAAVEALERKQPNNPVTHNLRGLALVLKREYTPARESFERALQLQANYMPAVTSLVRLDLREKNVDAAKKRYEQILQKEPKSERALRELAALLRVTGAPHKDVEEVLKRSVAANPQSPNARIGLIDFYARIRDTQSTLKTAQEAQAAFPNDARIVRKLGAAQLMAGEKAQAVSTFKRLVELQPNAVESHVVLARAHIAAKQPDEAIAALRAALNLGPELATIQRDITAIYMATGRPDAALREAKSMQAQHQKSPLGHALEAEIYIFQKKRELAEKKYLEALKTFDLPALAVRTHMVMAAGGKEAEANKLAEDWIKRHPKDAVVVAYLGDRDLAAKRYAAAEKRYHQALKRQPDNPKFLNSVAWVAHRLKRPDAIDYAERAHELAPSNVAVMDTLGVILIETGELERGLELLDRATDVAPNAHGVRMRLAKALINAGRKEAARKELQVLVKLDSRLPIQKEAAALLAGL
jgi:putative PEP-CTERM system TPR-repeat lipoprotein